MFAVPGRLTCRRSKPFSESHQRTVKGLFCGQMKMDIQDELHYDPDTGIFTWKYDKCSRARIGSIAGTITPTGYIQICLNGKLYRAHRLAFVLMTGELPPNYVDHIDGCKSNNAWSNLRLCTQSENLQNNKIGLTNTSGFLGVSADLGRGKWSAKIQVGGKTINIGRFNTKEEAAEAYLAKKKQVHTFSPAPRITK